MNEIKEIKEKADKGELIQYIVIKIDDEQYGINIKFIDNIVRMQQITRVPKVDAFLKGVINIRGEIVPVMSVRMKMLSFGKPPAAKMGYRHRKGI